MTKNKIFTVVVILLVVLLSIIFLKPLLIKKAFKPTPTTISQSVNQLDSDKDIQVISENLNIPWEIAFLPNNDILVTERPGKLLIISQSNQTIPIQNVEHIGEGGLLGLALHPDFKTNHWLYLYLTTKSDNGLTNRVDRYQLENNQLTNKLNIIKNIPGAKYHDGGRIAFGPDKLLYITTGDAGNDKLAQDLSVLNGKILRLNHDGSIPENNPFNSPVYSYGHRNPQGLAWDDQGRLWATEHGRSGIKSGYDELNLIEPGKNYGWPIIQGPETKENMVSPVAQSGPTDTWAPAGMAYINNSLFFAGLRGQALYQAKINQDKVSLTTHFNQEFGRLRAVVLGPDGFLYITTSNTDGRGEPNQNDDKLIRINPKIFNPKK